MKLVTSSKQTSQEKMRMSGMAGVLAKMHTTLTLKANHTFTATTSGIKGEAGSLKQQGKWSQAGNTVTLTDPDKPGRSQKFVMSKGGKEMTLSMGGVNIVLTR